MRSNIFCILQIPSNESEAIQLNDIDSTLNMSTLEKLRDSEMADKIATRRVGRGKRLGDVLKISNSGS